MKPEAQFTALRSDAEDNAHTSFEMVDMERSDHQSERSRNFILDNKEHQMTFREKFAAFPKKTFFIISLLPVALAPIIVLATAAEDASQNYILGRKCYPNGLWREADGATWRIMDSSYFFTPNLSFGSMNFTQVKVIDIAWDLIAGRGGQVLLAWVNYRVFNEWILYHMELHLTSYKMYTAVAFETTTINTLGVLAKEFLAFGKSTWVRFFRWLAMLSMVLSTLYVLAFPTLMAAMTGYITTYQSYIEDNSQNLVDEDKFRPVNFIIEDADRIGYASRRLICNIDDNALTEQISAYIDEYIVTPNVALGYGSPFSISLSTNVSSTWKFEDKDEQLSSPSLNITKLQKGNSAQSISPGIVHMYYNLNGREGQVYDATYIHQHGSCQPSDTYQWGFSYIFLFMMSIFNFIWSCVMIGMWFDTCRGSRMYKSGRRPGLLRSILDLSAAIREEIGSSVDHMEEDELRQRLRDSGGALMIPPKELRVARASTGEYEMRKRSWRRNLTKGSTF